MPLCVCDSCSLYESIPNRGSIYVIGRFLSQATIRSHLLRPPRRIVISIREQNNYCTRVARSNIRRERTQRNQTQRERTQIGPSSSTSTNQSECHGCQRLREDITNPHGGFGLRFSKLESRVTNIETRLNMLEGRGGIVEIIDI